jgi:hypothetical protein
MIEHESFCNGPVAYRAERLMLLPINVGDFLVCVFRRGTTAWPLSDDLIFPFKSSRV